MATTNIRRSNVWGHFTHFRTGDGKSKARCKKCSRVLAADTRNGTSSLRRHVLFCERLDGNQTDGNESNLLFGYEIPASSLSFPSDLPPAPQQQPPLLGDPSSPHGSSDHRASGLETADVGAARPPQPMSPPTTTLSLSLPDSSMHDQEEEVVQKMMSGLEELCNVSTDKVQVMGAAPICSVEEAVAMNVREAATPQQQPSGSGPAGGGWSDADSDHNPAGLSEHLTTRPCALLVSEEPNLEVEQQAHQEDEASRDLARMITLDGYDSSFLENDHFRSFVKRFNPEYEIPSRVSIENMCDGIADEAVRDLLDRLRRLPGKVNVAVGRAKTMEEQVLYVACHFIDDGWNLHKPVLHAIVTTDHHDEVYGPILGLDFDGDVGEIISDHGIHDRLFMVAYDEMTDKDIQRALKEYPLRALKEYGFFSTKPNRKEILFTTYVDNVLHSIARCLLPDDGSFLTLRMSRDMHSLFLNRQRRLELFAELDLNYGWAYDEHWYAFYCSLEVLRKKGFPHPWPDADKVIVNLLCKLWEKIYRAIQKISCSIRPTANLCLAEFFNLREVLQSELEGFSSGSLADIYPAFSEGKNVKHVLRDACDTLDKAVQDSYLAWSLALALDPRYKLEPITFIFERLCGLTAKECVSKVTAMITELYADYVKEYGTTDGPDHSDTARVMDTTTSADDPFEQAWNEHCRSQQGIATQIISSCYPEAETELDRYLKDPLASHHPQAAEDFDILNWWNAHSSEYPIVARMARDALAMPTCSKLSSNQMAQVRSILRAYTKDPY